MGDGRMATGTPTPPEQGTLTSFFSTPSQRALLTFPLQKQTAPPDMSERSTHSPSTVIYRGQLTSSNFPQYPPPDPLDSLSRPISSIRRRTVHPHNPPMRRFHGSQESAQGASRPNHPPRLEHRASQTLTIDLTDEDDELQMAQRPPQERPQAVRSSGLNQSNVIDLTEDNDADDVEITRVAPRPLPSISDMSLNVPRGPHTISGSRGRFMPQEPVRHVNRVFPSHSPVRSGFHVTALGQGDLIFHPSPNFLDHIQMLEDATAILGQMDRENLELRRRRDDLAQAGQGRPEHVPPPAAKAGFTRSPTEEDVVICPSCEEELIHDKEPDEPAVKKGGKAPTRKEREEHPFWVVKSCGHVSLCASSYPCPG
jgi:hypothetical protein